jgi:hypothetical protein
MHQAWIQSGRPTAPAIVEEILDRLELENDTPHRRQDDAEVLTEAAAARVAE